MCKVRANSHARMNFCQSVQTETIEDKSKTTNQGVELRAAKGVMRR